MPIRTFDISVGVILDKATLDSQVSALYNEVKNKPLLLNTKMQMPNQAEAQRILDSIKNQATAIEDVTVKQEEWISNMGNAPVKELTEMTVRWRDANGNVFTTVEKIANSISTLGADYSRLSKETAKFTPGKQAEELTRMYDKRLKSFESMEKKARDWSIRAEEMNRKEKVAIQSSAKELERLINLYRTQLSSGTTAGLSVIEDKIKKQNQALEDNISSTKRAAGGVRGWIENINNAIKQTVSYTLSLGSMRIAIDSVNKGIQYAIDLNKEMVKIQVLQAEGAQTDEEISNLAKSYNELAKELGATTIEIAQGSVEWLRQGKTIEETTELLRASTMLSKLGNMEAAESTEYLTSTLNSYGLEAENAVSVVDKLVQVDNISATSTKELATALRYSAASAKDAGVSLEQLISYIAVVSSTTRQNAESIGQAMKTMLARMQDIKAGAIDEDGLGLNNVESALKRVNIELRDTPTTFRDMSAVLEDVAEKWSTLNDIEQENIAKAIAG